MQQEKDFIKREIQRLSIFLSKLIGSLQEIEENDIKSELDQISNELKGELGFDLNDIENMDDTTLIEKIKNLNELNVEQLAFLLATIDEKTGIRDKRNNWAPKAILLLDRVDSMSDIFSIKRMELKNKLKQRL